MMNRRMFWIAPTLLLLPAAALAFIQAPPLRLVSSPTPTAQVGMPYNSSITVADGVPPYSILIVSGSLPPGLTLSDSTTGAITGTPTTAGQFTFSVLVTDSAALPTDALNAARKHTSAQSGNHSANLSLPSITITVSGASAAGAPMSPWTLCLIMAGLVTMGLLRLRQARRA